MQHLSYVMHIQAVFFDDNQVFLKKNTTIGSQEVTEIGEWFPINFQWIPILHLNKNLNHQSNISSTLLYARAV